MKVVKAEEYGGQVLEDNTLYLVKKGDEGSLFGAVDVTMMGKLALWSIPTSGRLVMDVDVRVPWKAYGPGLLWVHSVRAYLEVPEQPMVSLPELTELEDPEFARFSEWARMLGLVDPVQLGDADEDPELVDELDEELGPLDHGEELEEAERVDLAEALTGAPSGGTLPLVEDPPEEPERAQEPPSSAGGKDAEEP